MPENRQDEDPKGGSNSTEQAANSRRRNSSRRQRSQNSQANQPAAQQPGEAAAAPGAQNGEQNNRRSRRRGGYRRGNQNRRSGTNERQEANARDNANGRDANLQPAKSGDSQSQSEPARQPAVQESTGNGRRNMRSRGRGSNRNRRSPDSASRDDVNREKNPNGERKSQPAAPAQTAGNQPAAGENNTGAPRSAGRRRNGRRGQSNTAAGQNGANRASTQKSAASDDAQTRRPPERQRAAARSRSSFRSPRRAESRWRDDSRWYTNPYAPPSVPIVTDQGIKARSQHGEFSQNWWARRWIEAMERLVPPARLQRGRSYARSGQVLSIEETRRGVRATVQGSREVPYKVSIQVTPLTRDQWNLVIDALAEQALFTAQLLAGEMPENIEEAFESAGISLFPTQAGDLTTKCSCPDWANPCKHVAATHYILGERFDDDPFLIFRMRGRNQDQILRALRKRRTAQDEAEDEAGEPAEAVEETAAVKGTAQIESLLDHFWDPVEPLDSFQLSIKPPQVEMPVLKRLGDPAFLGNESLIDLLGPVYETFTRSALKAAYTEEEESEKD